MARRGRKSQSPKGPEWPNKAKRDTPIKLGGQRIQITPDKETPSPSVTQYTAKEAGELYSMGPGAGNQANPRGSMVGEKCDLPVEKRSATNETERGENEGRGKKAWADPRIMTAESTRKPARATGEATHNPRRAKGDMRRASE